MHSLVEDVKTFSEHLTKTEKCSCKLAKYDKDGNEAESFLETNKQINDEPIKVCYLIFSGSFFSFYLKKIIFSKTKKIMNSSNNNNNN